MQTTIPALNAEVLRVVARRRASGLSTEELLARYTLVAWAMGLSPEIRAEITAAILATAPEGERRPFPAS
jgi:hypothetical protein